MSYHTASGPYLCLSDFLDPFWHPGFYFHFLCPNPSISYLFAIQQMVPEFSSLYSKHVLSHIVSVAQEEFNLSDAGSGSFTS